MDTQTQTQTPQPVQVVQQNNGGSKKLLIGGLCGLLALCCIGSTVGFFVLSKKGEESLKEFEKEIDDAIATPTTIVESETDDSDSDTAVTPTKSSSVTPTTSSSTTSTPTKTPTSNTSGATEYTSTSAGFGLSYPSTWTIEEDIDFEGTSIPLILYSPEESATDGFAENVNVITLDSSIEEEVKALTSNGGTSFPNFTVISNTRSSSNGVNMIEVVYTWSSEGTSIKQKQVFFETGSKRFLLTYSATNDSNFDKYLTDVNNMVKTFTIK